VKYPGKEMNMDVHGTNTNHDLPLATKFKRTSVVFWEGVDAQYEREVLQRFEVSQVETSG